MSLRRTKPMNPGKGFRRPTLERVRAEVRPSALKASPCRMFDGTARMSVPVPKLEKAKPGKRTPTVEERRWMDAITAIGCIACLLEGRPGVLGAVHHLLRGGQRIGHLHSICLCDPGHHQNGGPGVACRHPYKARFEAKYGTEESLLERSRALAGWECEPAASQATTED